MLRSSGHHVTAIGRLKPTGAVSLADQDAWRRALTEVEAVMHLAGRAHVMNDVAASPLGEYRKINRDGTLCVAQAAVEAGVRRFVFVSSIGVLGNESGPRGFSEETPPAPVEPYAVSKYEAELALKDLEHRTGLEIVVVRPPLVYGPHVKGNFHRLLRLVANGVPLPLGSVRNRRSFIGVTNLSELLLLCAVRPLGAQRLFVACDGRDVSTPELLSMMSSQMNRPNRVFRFPTTTLRLLARLAGADRELRRLTGNLHVDSALASSVLQWAPSKSLETGIGEMVDWFVRSST